MINNIKSKIFNILSKFTKKNNINDFEIKDIIKNIRKTLLEADVNWDVVKTITTSLKQSISKLPSDKKCSIDKQVLKLIYNEIIKIITPEKDFEFNIINENKTHIILFLGLQGVGKTTNIIKYANFIKKHYKKKLLITSCDIYRAAAIEQLKILSKINNIDFFDITNQKDIETILKTYIDYAKKNNYDCLFVDTAGRLHIDELMMSELKNIYTYINPTQAILVVDSISGQDSINVINKFNNIINITGIIVTKMDGTSKGGIILSLSYKTKIPILFLSVGENINDLEKFNPKSIVSRILGVGDIDGIMHDINNINENIMHEQHGDNQVDLNSLKNQLEVIIKTDNIKNIIDKIPYNDSMKIDESKLNKLQFKKMLSIINSMTSKERVDPNILNGSRKIRIAKGSGNSIFDVNQLLKYFKNIKLALKRNKHNKII